MFRGFSVLVLGFMLGCAAWAIVPLVSNKFEPFDSGIGMLIGQLVSSAVAGYLGFSRGVKAVLMFVAGLYVGFNVYAYTFGSTDIRAMFALGLLTNIFLCIYPLMSGLFGKIIAMLTARIAARRNA